jgi:hypothetical protein
MTPVGHMTLVFIAVDVLEGAISLKTKIDLLRTQSEGLAISNVYKRSQQSPLSSRFFSELVVVVKAETYLSVEKLSLWVKEKMGNSAAILSFDSDVFLLPDLNLPHPLLHTDPLTLRCACEVWGSYEHPVLGQTLNELVQLELQTKNYEFFSQGNSLLN